MICFSNPNNIKLNTLLSQVTRFCIEIDLEELPEISISSSILSHVRFAAQIKYVIFTRINYKVSVIYQINISA